MERLVALCAEVFAGRDEADAEDLFPESVRDDSGGQRVVRVNEPLRQREPVRRGVFWQRRKRSGRTFRHLLAEVFEVASVLELGLATHVRGEFLHDRHGHRRLEVGQLLHDRRELVPVGLQLRRDRDVVLGKLLLLRVGSFVRRDVEDCQDRGGSLREFGDARVVGPTQSELAEDVRLKRGRLVERDDEL